MPCRVLDSIILQVGIRLSNLPFLKEDTLKEQLKKSLEPYVQAFDLGKLWETSTNAYVGMVYAALNIPKDADKFSLLSYHLPGINQKMKSLADQTIFSSVLENSSICW